MAGKLLIFLAGLMAGAGLTLWGVRSGSGRSSAAAELETAATAELSALSEEFDRVSARIGELEAEKEDLQVQLQELKVAPPVEEPAEPAPARPNGARSAVDHLTRQAIANAAPTNNSTRAAMQELMRSTLRQQVEGKIEQMQERLHLTPEQAERARAILEGQVDLQAGLAEKILQGEGSPAELAKQGEPQANPEEQILALLTPQQREGYLELQQEERRNSARLMANAELLQMQSVLGLSEGQQDQVFRALYAESSQLLGGPGGLSRPGEAPDPRGSLERKLQALSGVLTPEQYERYQRMQEQQLKLMEAFLPRDGQPGDVAIPNIQLLPQGSP